jgi:hypothetical protein
MAKHVYDSKKRQNKIAKAFRKYGRPQWEILEFCDKYETLLEREVVWIERLGTVDNGYNISHGGDANPMDSMEARSKIQGQNNPMYGKRGPQSPSYGRRGELHVGSKPVVSSDGQWFASASCAARSFGAYKGAIYDAIRYKARANGVHWSWADENKRPIDSSHWGKPPVKKPVINSDGVVFESSRDAEKQLGIARSCVGQSITNGCRAGGFYWRFLD